MPEAPDLQIVKEFLAQRIVGQKIVDAEERKPLVLRNMRRNYCDQSWVIRFIKSTESILEFMVGRMSNAQDADQRSLRYVPTGEKRRTVESVNQAYSSIISKNVIKKYLINVVDEVGCCYDSTVPLND